MRFKSLGSGSTGNATVIEATTGTQTSRLLVDCGFGIRQLDQRLASAGLCAADLDAVFITHEHADHIGCVRQLAVREQLPVWMSRGTRYALNSPDIDPWLCIARDGEALAVGHLQVMPFTVPHDAREPLQLTCSDGDVTVGVLTDLGHVTAHVTRHLQGCHALLLECNHDPDLVAQSGYPAFLKQRITGRLGHLANQAAADLLRALGHGPLRHVVAAHLSLQNNAPALARQALAEALGSPACRITLADAESGTEWLAV